MSEIAMNSETIEASKELVDAAKRMVFNGWTERAVLEYLQGELQEAGFKTYRKKRYIRDLNAFLDHLNGVSVEVIKAEYGDKHADINRSIRRGIHIMKRVLSSLTPDQLRAYYATGISSEDKKFWEAKAEEAIALLESQNYLNALDRG